VCVCTVGAAAAAYTITYFPSGRGAG
jgi:hypothetical protein